MQGTGSVHHTALGTFDSSKGDFRLLNVHAGETRFVDFTKVSDLIHLFCDELNQFMQHPYELMDCLQASFSRDKEDVDIFRQFLYKQYEKMLLLEIRKARKSITATVKPGGSDKSGGLSMIF